MMQSHRQKIEYFEIWIWKSVERSVTRVLEKYRKILNAVHQWKLWVRF